MTAQEVAYEIAATIEISEMVEFGGFVTDVTPFAEAGVMTRDAGFVVRTEDGSEFQITVVRSRGPRS